MIQHYEFINGILQKTEASEINAPVLLAINPTPSEMESLVKQYNLDEHTAQSALDPDEISRIESEPDLLSIIFKRPKSYSANDMFLFRVLSIGVFISKETIIILLPESIDLTESKLLSRVTSNKDLLLKLIYLCIFHFLGHLKVINKISDELEDKVNTSMENRNLINMFALEKSLVYYLNAIHSNSVVIEKLKTGAVKFGFTPEQVEFLDDIIIENQQCYKQAEIYSNVLTGLMDARGSIVNNNLNILIKRLTIINIVFMPLNLIAGIGGMSEFSMMTTGTDWKIAYSFFMVGMVVVGFITFFLIERIGNGKHSKR